MEFTKEELNKLVAFIDLAVKAAGLAAASEALQLVAKIQEMAKSIDDKGETA